MKVLTVEQVIELHTRLIQATGGLDGVRDQTTPNMIQGLKGIFAIKPLISREI